MLNLNTSKPIRSEDLSTISASPSVTRRFCSLISSRFTIGNLTKTAFAVSAFIGASMMSTAQSRQESLESVAFTSAALSLTCLLSTLTNAPSKANNNMAKMFLIGMSLNAVAGKSLMHSANTHCGGSSITPNFISLPKEARAEHHFVMANLAGYDLLSRVETSLRNGGKIVRKNPAEIGGIGGAYLIKDKDGQTLALFKPEDEGLYGTQNPNPQLRKKALSADDIYFHMVDSFEQGKPAGRQHLAALLHHGELSKPPSGMIADLTSDLFIDIESETSGMAPKLQTKRGYLQEWILDVKPLISHHPVMKKMVEENAFNEEVIKNLHKEFANHPLLDAVSLDEFQEICINDFLIYNEDRHAGNILVSFDNSNAPHLIPIDQDAILPWKFRHLQGIYSHAKSREPFTQKSLELIASIDPDLIEAIVQKMDLSPQASINAKMMAIVVKKFAAAGLKVHDIEKFVSNGDRTNYEQNSKLWELAVQCKTTAVDRLPSDDKAAWVHSEYLRRGDWCLTMNEPWCKPLSAGQRPEAALWQKNYAKEHAARISSQVQINFWSEFESLLNIKINQL